MAIIHYEVYVLETRGWMLHARYPRKSRDTAYSEIRELEQLSFKVRVVREIYYADTNTFDEADVYVTGKGFVEGHRPANFNATSGAAATSPAGRGPPRKGPPPRKAAKPPSGNSHVFARLLAIVAVGISAGLVAVKITPDVILWLWRLGLFRVEAERSTYGAVFLAVFVLAFLMVTVPLANRFLPHQTEIELRGRRRTVAQARVPTADDRARRLKASVNRLAREVSPEAAAEIVALPAEEMFEESELHHHDDEQLPEIREYPDDEPPPKAADTKPAATTAAAEADLPAVTRFQNSAMAAVKAAAATMDNYNKFALHLYLAGGVETLCEMRKRNNSTQQQLVTSALGTLGTAPDVAGRFHDKLGEYLMEPRYMQVMQAGRNAMAEFLSGREAEAHSELKSVLREWNRPAEKKAAIVTVMFTDMVGSTDLTQAVGDAGAQEIVRRHNAIVRSAVAQYGGREIKHTGDGIMASFPSATGAVEAAVNIQRNVAAHNQKIPSQSLHLRIGLNSGEPIQEEDDLFGTTVQLAARVCAATAQDQILCTSVVRDLAMGKGASFHAAGTHTLKGFRDPLPLFEVNW